MRVLFVNHTGRVSGAEHSLLELLAGLPADVHAVLACPPGKLTGAVQELGVPVVPIPPLEGSLRIHPVYSARGLIQVGCAAVRLRSEVGRIGANLIHANTIRAGLIAVLAAKRGGPPVVVHVRDCLPASALANLARRSLLAGASMLIANSRYTATNFTRGRYPGKVITVHNPVDVPRFSPNGLTCAKARGRLGLDAMSPVLGIIGQLAPWKAHDDAIRCLALLRSTWPRACLVLVGNTVFDSKATRYDNKAYAKSLRRLADDFGLNGSVRFLGEREDIPEVLRALDLLLVPSWEEPFGRTVVEAMAMQVPVVATSIGGPAEIITDGVDGVLLPPRQPETWATVIDWLLSQPKHLEEIGRRGRCTATARFSVQAHVDAVLKIYGTLLAADKN